MSYILQALKESEAKREANAAPEAAVRAPEYDMTADPGGKKRHAFVWWLGGAVLAALVAGILLFKLPADASKEMAVGSEPIPAPADAAAQGSASENEKSELVGVKLVLNPPAERKHAATGDNPSTVKPAETSKAFIRVPEKSAPAPAEAQIEPDPYANIPYLRQLPAEIQRELPELRFSVHIYAESRFDRRVKLGDRMMSEGQRVKPELRIEEIIPRGVVMRYREQLFKVPTR
ncbi:general secretion pathway protein GspB [Marinobacterium sp. D7]|uniref:general secretion pathway protein GspB n=1 Tax=Marinobacterium ramblicola TaxID=2849041 RepID=UPI001C2DCE51|nr:general secretion pathway protein GspB [Marinobacterium ramblicola]MBV1787967.1 general secretion pathway protein GspB [Marinobacterium ramblicola]